MREWLDDYGQNAFQKGKRRCDYLHRLTGVSEQAIWEWGYIQTVSTAFVLLQIGQEDTGYKMLRVAESWAEGCSSFWHGEDSRHYHSRDILEYDAEK